MADSFNAIGVNTRIDFRDEWYENRRDGEIELVLKGIYEFHPTNSNPCLFWYLYPWGDGEFQDLILADFVFVASQDFEKRIIEHIGQEKVEVLQQCTDSRLFSPERFDSNLETDILFVGSGTIDRRRYGAVKMAIEAGQNVSVWGKKWGSLPANHLKGEYIDNNDLGSHYASAKLVLNDHRPHMKENGFLNNRVYDVLACATPVVTDKISSFPDEIIPYIYQYDDVTSMKIAVEKALSESVETKQHRNAFAKNIRENHSFDARANEILKVINKLIATRIRNGDK